MKGRIKSLLVILYLLLAAVLICSLSAFLLRHNVADPTLIWIVLGLATGGVFTMALYSFTLYLFRPTERELVFFAFFCLAVCLRFLFVDGSMGTLLFPQAARMETSLFAIGSAIMVICHFNFICELFADSGYRRCRWCISVLIPLYTLAVLMLGVINTPLEVVIKVFISLTETILSVMVLIRSGQLRNQPVNLLYFVTNLWYFISFYLVSTQVPFLIVPTNCVFMIAHIIVLADRYARAIRGQEEINARLEVTVAERTAELQQAYTQVAASEEGLKELVGDISHDLKTPLTVVGLNLEQLTDAGRPRTPEESRQLAAVAYQRTLDLQRLTRNLFELVRMERGQAVYHLQWVPVSHLMNEVQQRYADYIELTGVLPVIRYREEGMEVSIDPEKIWSVFDNLINNALRYTLEEGQITITAGKTGDGKVELVIRDNGSGIEKEHLPHIFERYYKADRARSSGDSGLGLYIVKTLVEGMGGTVDAASAPGDGMAVKICLKGR